ncbi:MAG: glucosaminidase domain-containing protein [Eubacteriaceae bacterium]|jgi:beta-N-acetylglucosaminidase|nr:glucosaminidase domain-containing protein [Eubacteriaceae bacterium]
MAKNKDNSELRPPIGGGVAQESKTGKKAAVLAMLLAAAFFPTAAEAAEAPQYTVERAFESFAYESVSGPLPYKEALEVFSSLGDPDLVLRDASGKVCAMKGGIAISDASEAILVFQTAFAGGTAAYIDNGEVMAYIAPQGESGALVSVAGYSGVASLDGLTLVPSAFCQFRNKIGRISESYYYKSKEGDLVHAISYARADRKSTYFYHLPIDRAPGFMEHGMRYYSLDGKDFFGSPEDAVAGKRRAGRHLVYYQFLSFRSVTGYGPEDLKSYLDEKDRERSAGSPSAYVGAIQSFFRAQATFGVNAAMEFSFANHESDFGHSWLAADRNNFFGVAAYDSGIASARAYATAEEGILSHSESVLNRSYFDAYAYIDTELGDSFYDVPARDKGYIASYEGDSRYFGAYPGNKATGVNVRYASDPYHGEKIAGHMYALDKWLGMKDYRRYTIGQLKRGAAAYAYPSKGSFALYKYTSKDPDRAGGLLSETPEDICVTVIGECGAYYQVLSEMPVSRNRRASNMWAYNRSYSFAFVRKSDVSIEIRGSGPLNSRRAILASLRLSD